MQEVEAGLYLRLRVEGAQVEVQAAALVPRWSRALLHAPILTRETHTRFLSPGAETVLCLLDARGGIVASFGFSERPRVFFDRKASKRREGLAGVAGAPSQNVREISVPLPPSVKFLCFYRSELRFTGGLEASSPEFRQECVALYSTARPGEATLPAPPLPVRPLAAETLPVNPLRWLAPRDARRSE